MRACLTLIRRELGGYFLSMIGYVIIAAALFLMGESFVVMLEKLRLEPTQMPLTELFYNTAYFWLILLLTTPLITMRLFALEKYSGTFETLMTAPVSDLAVVLAKFLAAFVFYALLWLPVLGCVWIVRHYTNDTTAFDTGATWTTFLGILLLGGMFVSMGCCASALTRNQAVAAMISLVFGVSLFLLAFLADRHPETRDWQAQVLSSFALFTHMRDFVRGVIDTRVVVLYTTLTLFFLFLTLRVVESRRWR
jgi:ABC-2 type transport system permease protein